MMKINFTDSSKLIENALLVIGVYNDLKLNDFADVVDHIPQEIMFKGEVGESAVVAPRAILIGLGSAKELDTINCRKIGHHIYEALSKYPSGQVQVLLPCNVMEVTYGIVDASWQFTKYKTLQESKKYEVSIYAKDPKTKAAFANHQHVLQGVFFARDLIAEPSNVLTTTEFKDRCLALKEHGLVVEVLEREQLEKLGMNAVLGIAKGSISPPYVITIKHNGAAKEPPVAFVGKGVCFDSGGISLKKPLNMHHMRHDMSGAAAVVGTLLAAALQKLPVNVVGVIGLIENMPNNNALKPGDIIKSMAGKTIEVITTDAEGRLLLADCLFYIQQKYRPAVMIDLATLTPETVCCLGHEYAGLYTDDDTLANKLHQLGIATQDKVWRLPMGKYFAKQIESKFADMQNLGVEWGGENGAAAEFLRNFIGDCKSWVHLDIAGVAWNYDALQLNFNCIPGFGVKLLDGYLKSIFEKDD